MKIKVSINGKKCVIAEIQGKGHLGTHINLDDKKGSGSPKVDVSTSGYDTNNDAETIHLKWAKRELSAGDEISIVVMPDDDLDADKPEKERRSSEKKVTMIDDSAIADKILDVANDINKKFSKLLNELKNGMSKEDTERLGYAIVSLIDEIYIKLIEPIYRRHPEKVPEDMKDMPL